MTRPTAFFRLLADDDKGAALADAIETVRDTDVPCPAVQEVNPSSFRLVPTAPFSYWVSERVRRMFVELPSFESDGREVRVGLQTGDDFRFVRAWWEVAPERTLDGGNGPYHDVPVFQGWCRQRTYEGRRWVPFAKGGEYSPFYADIHLVINWECDGAELRSFDGSVIRNPDYYFRPGLTWPIKNRFSFKPWPLPSGCIFAHVGAAAFFKRGSIAAYQALMSSSSFTYLLRVMAGWNYEVGIVQQIPIPPGFVPALASQAARQAAIAVRAKRDVDAADETSHAALPTVLLNGRTLSIADGGRVWQMHVRACDEKLEQSQLAIDEVMTEIYGIGDITWHDDARTRDSRETEEILAVSFARGEEGQPPVNSAGGPTLARLVVSYAVGCSFGRWDVRVAADRSLAAKLPDPFAPLPVSTPCMLVGTDALPARQGEIASEDWLRARSDTITPPLEGVVRPPTIPDVEYPIRIAWDGILVDDPDHVDDVVRRVRDICAHIWTHDAAAAEEEACELLAATDLSEYFRRPGLFFADHLKRYSKSRRQAPIYWPLSTASGSYTIWLYYQRLTSDTLFSAIRRYVEPKIVDVERQVREARDAHSSASGREGSRLLTRIEELTNFLGELNDFRDELLRVTQLPYRPNLDDGVIINAAPLHKLFRLPKWAKDTREVWQKLERGDYDWAHMAYTIWPDRVREKCRSDRSLAIAHNLEHLFSGPPPSAGKRRARAATLAIDEDDE